MNKLYTIYYLVENEINAFNNTLHFASESQMLKDLINAYKIKIESSHMNHVTCARKEILAYREDIDITKADLKIVLEKLVYKLEDIRYIIELVHNFSPSMKNYFRLEIKTNLAC